MTATLTLTCADGVTLPATVLRAAERPRGAVVIAPALGVPRRFYQKFAAFLQLEGYDTLCFDYRGIDGAGAEVAADQIKLADWGRQDLQAALLAARTELQAPRLFLVGHSVGGQIPGLAAGAGELDAMVFVAASAPYPRRYALKDRMQIEFMWRVLVPLLGRGRTFPARKLGFASVDIPSSVMRQWAAWGLSPGYLFDARHRIDIGAYARLKQPILSFSFADDGYASKAAVEALHAHYPAAHIEHRHLERQAGHTYGHFGYFREAQRDGLWRETADWLSAQAAP